MPPRDIKFYNTNWRALIAGTGNDKTNGTILDIIHEATSITREELDWRKLYSIPISRRMQWAAARQVTREEDTAYSLMGIFGVSISIAYGEGAEPAFFRLVQAILSTNKRGLLDITNWGYGHKYPKSASMINASWVIPLSPKQFTWSTATDIDWYPSTKPIILTHLGLQVSVLLMPAITTEWHTPQPSSALGDYYATVADVDSLYPNNTVRRKNYAVLEKSIFRSSRMQGTDGPGNPSVLCFGVLNFSETSNWVQLPLRGRAFAIPIAAGPPLVCGSASEETRFVREQVCRHF